jgi:hypothetical protein
MTKQGRPCKPKGQRKNVTVHVKFTEQEKAQLDFVAKMTGQTASRILRTALFEHCRKIQQILEGQNQEGDPFEGAFDFYKKLRPPVEEHLDE